MKSSSSPVLLVIGTRPEGIKIAPVYHALIHAGIPTFLCSTAQHTTLLNDVFSTFNMVPDISFNSMRLGQDIFYITEIILQKMKSLLHVLKPRLVVVQGDTTSSLVGALAAFYCKVPIAHIEAGLRTDDIYAPFPEEMNRRIITRLATHHFAPTHAAVENLKKDGVPDHAIMMTGNTGIDAVHIISEKIRNRVIKVRPFLQDLMTQWCANQKNVIVLFTVHRRELWQSLDTIFTTLLKIIHDHENLVVIYPYHHNPLIAESIKKHRLFSCSRIFLCDALPYHELIYVMNEASCIITDSGGIQEEATTLGKPFVVIREKTERNEGLLDDNGGILGGIDSSSIERACTAMIASCYGNRSVDHRPWTTVYGDGHASQRIVTFIHDTYFSKVQLLETKAESFCQGTTSMEKVIVIGLGYIGLPTAILIAETKRYTVVGYDINKERVARISNADPVIQEPEIAGRLSQAIVSRLLQVTSTFETADYYIIAVPTPLTDDKKADVSAVFHAADALVECLQKGQTIIIESTIPVGTTEKVAQRIEQKTGFKEGVDFFIVYCPERVIPGTIFHELVTNDRVIGALSLKSGQRALALYKSFVRGTIEIVPWAMAELTKLAENSYRDVQIAFAHQLATIARSEGFDPYDVIAHANKHPRISILKPTCGVGGHCLAVDPWFLAESYPEATRLIQEARRVNDSVRYEVCHAIDEAVRSWHIKENRKPRVTLLGLAYKANVDDMRESPALAIAQICARTHDRETSVFDPHCAYDAMVIPGAVKADSLTDCVLNADIIVFLVAHTRFVLLDRAFFDHKVVLDFCGIMYEKKSANVLHGLALPEDFPAQRLNQ